MAQHAALEVLHPAPGIERLAGQRIAVDGVDGEVAPRARLLERKERVALGAEGAVAEAKLGLTPRQGDVDVVAVDLEDAEGRAHEVERVVARKRRLQPVRRDAEALEVEVLGLAAEDFVADAAAHEQGASPFLADYLGDFGGDAAHACCSSGLGSGFEVSNSAAIGSPLSPKQSSGRTEKTVWPLIGSSAGEKRQKPGAPSEDSGR